MPRKSIEDRQRTSRAGGWHDWVIEVPKSWADLGLTLSRSLDRKWIFHLMILSLSLSRSRSLSAVGENSLRYNVSNYCNYRKTRRNTH